MIISKNDPPRVYIRRDGKAKEFIGVMDYFEHVPALYENNVRVQVAQLHIHIMEEQADDVMAEWSLNEDGLWACTNCGGVAIKAPHAPDTWQTLTKFCPHCGYRTRSSPATAKHRTKGQ